MSGDLIIKIKVKEDNVFKREGYDIYTEEKISVVKAVLGTTLNVNTIDGLINLNIPAGTSHGSKIKLPGKGV